MRNSSKSRDRAVHLADVRDDRSIDEKIDKPADKQHQRCYTFTDNITENRNPIELAFLLKYFRSDNPKTRMNIIPKTRR